MIDPKTENKLFNYFTKRHQLLLTTKELDEVQAIVTKGWKSQEDRLSDVIITYRVVNVVVLGIMALIGWQFGLRAIVAIFVLYNLTHAIVLKVRQRKRRARNG